MKTTIILLLLSVIGVTCVSSCTSPATTFAIEESRTMMRRTSENLDASTMILEAMYIDIARNSDDDRRWTVIDWVDPGHGFPPMPTYREVDRWEWLRSTSKAIGDLRVRHERTMGEYAGTVDSYLVTKQGPLDKAKKLYWQDVPQKPVATTQPEK